MSARRIVRLLPSLIYAGLVIFSRHVTSDDKTWKLLPIQMIDFFLFSARRGWDGTIRSVLATLATLAIPLQASQVF
jgi:hypothetical protein